LDNSLDIRAELDAPRRSRASKDLRVASHQCAPNDIGADVVLFDDPRKVALKDSVDKSLASLFDLPLREGPERVYFGPSSERFGDSRKSQHIGRTGEDEPTRLPVFVDGELDRREELRSELDFVDHDVPRELRKEAAGVTVRELSDAEVVES